MEGLQCNDGAGLQVDRHAPVGQRLAAHQVCSFRAGRFKSFPCPRYLLLGIEPSLEAQCNRERGAASGRRGRNEEQAAAAITGA